MNLERFERRQAVIAWRDRWQLDLWTMMSEAGQHALNELQTDLGHATTLDAHIHQADFVNSKIDKAMRSSLERLLNDARIDAASELHEIDPAFDDLGLELYRTDFGDLLPKIAAASQVPNHEGFSLNKGISLIKGIGIFVGVSAGSLVSPAAGALMLATGIAASRAAPIFHGLVRDAGSNRLAQVWLGTVGDPLPVAPRVAHLFDSIAARARKIMS